MDGWFRIIGSVEIVGKWRIGRQKFKAYDALEFTRTDITEIQLPARQLAYTTPWGALGVRDILDCNFNHHIR